jgi:hypothetical protein
MAHTSMRGKVVDMEKLMSRNELTPAVGNAGYNARGDRIGPGGKIIQTREEMMAQYYETSPKAKHMTSGPVATKPAAVVKEEVKPAKTKTVSDEE